MAKTLVFKLTTIFSILLLLLALHSDRAISYEIEDGDVDTEDEYFLDSIYTNTTTTTTRKSRFLYYNIKKIKAGAQCGTKKNRYVCNGVWANKGKSLLHCCLKQCRDVLNDVNHCGRCGKRCAMGRRCCGGICTNVLRDKKNCGKCNKKCRRGVKCEFGYCGYGS